MKKTILAMGLLSSTILSSLNASMTYHRVTCIDSKPQPDATQAISLYENPQTNTSFVKYTYTNILGAKKTIESMNCKSDGLDSRSSSSWKCIGHLYEIDFISIVEDKFEVFLYSIEDGNLIASSKVFNCH